MRVGTGQKSERWSKAGKENEVDLESETKLGSRLRIGAEGGLGWIGCQKEESIDQTGS